ncbi:MAG: hypothetical protein U0L83_05145 [Muribaculaceae bacterium]|nr:hypothetical protein [Muribaculaceae bacterium]
MKTLPFIALMCAIMLAACVQTTDQSKRADARRLYIRSAELAKLYGDSIQAAKDSATVNRLDSTYLAELTKLNLSVPPETDIWLTEGENDTLFMLTETYVEIRARRLGKALPTARPDSFASDSTQAATTVPTAG